VNAKSADHRFPIGVMMVLLSAVLFGLLTTLARVAYDGGSNAITVALMRSGFAVAAGFMLCFFLKRDWRVQRQGIPVLFWVAVGQTGMSVFYLGAVQYISVSLGAILFYTYPILVLIIEAIIRHEVPGRVRVMVFLAAFGGLVLALGPSLDTMDWRGIAFAVGASASATLLFFSTRHARHTVNETALLIWGSGLGIPIMFAVAPFMGGLALPETNTGWVGLWSTCFFFAAAFLAYAIGLRHIAPSRAAMYFNLEPVVSVVAAGVLLSEMLMPTQGAGALLVLAALILSAWRERHLRPRKTN